MFKVPCDFTGPELLPFDTAKLMILIINYPSLLLYKTNSKHVRFVLDVWNFLS